MRLVGQIAAGVFLGNLALALLAWAMLTVTANRALKEARGAELDRTIEELSAQRNANRGLP
jgi:hypothetical protein